MRKYSTSLETFFDAITTAVRSHGATGVFALDDVMAEIADSGHFLSAVANAELRKILTDREYDSPYWEGRSLVIGSGPGWHLRLSLYTHSSEYIYTLPFNMCVAVLGESPLLVHYYDISGPVDIAVFDPTRSVTLKKTEHYRPGTLVHVHNDGLIFDVNVERPVLTLKLISATVQPLQWAFDRQTGTAIQPIAANPVDSELVSLVQALASMERSGAEAASMLTNHPRHFVRWAALQALGKLDPDTTVSKLRGFLDDPHPHVRSAARAALQKLG